MRLTLTALTGITLGWRLANIAAEQVREREERRRQQDEAAREAKAARVSAKLDEFHRWIEAEGPREAMQGRTDVRVPFWLLVPAQLGDVDDLKRAYATYCIANGMWLVEAHGGLHVFWVDPKVNPMMECAA